MTLGTFRNRRWSRDHFVLRIALRAWGLQDIDLSNEPIPLPHHSLEISRRRSVIPKSGPYLSNGAVYTGIDIDENILMPKVLFDFLSGH